MESYLAEQTLDEWETENAADLEALMELENETVLDKNVFESKTQFPRNPAHVLNQEGLDRQYTFSSQASLVSSPTYHSHQVQPISLPKHSLLSSSQTQPEERNVSLSADATQSQFISASAGSLEDINLSSELFPDTNTMTLAFQNDLGTKPLDDGVAFGWESDSEDEMNHAPVATASIELVNSSTDDSAHSSRLRNAFNAIGQRSSPLAKLNQEPSITPLKRAYESSAYMGPVTEMKRRALDDRVSPVDLDLDAPLTPPPMINNDLQDSYDTGMSFDDEEVALTPPRLNRAQASTDHEEVTLTPPRPPTLNNDNSRAPSNNTSGTTNASALPSRPSALAPEPLDATLLAKRIKSRTNNYTLHTRYRNYKSEPPTGTFLLAKTSRGTTLHVPTRKTYSFVSGAVTAQLGNDETRKRPVQLLSTPLHKLIDKVRDMQRLDRLEAAEQEMEAFGDDGRYSMSKGGNQLMWVDKYAPKRYIDLVGDERINRSVLSWVKQWDPCVFKKEVKHTSLNQQSFRGRNNNPNPAGQPEKKRVQDRFHRPEKRILLLSGPPGLGKTTLAHIVAKHCGYNVIEINASDDRSGESVKHKILSAIECQAVLGSKKPNLVIIDEIDGALDNANSDSSLIKVLVDLATIINSTTDSQKPDGIIKKGKKKRTELLRPIICICNDVYAPVLRPLRAVAEMHAFKPPLFQDLARRLRDICTQEGIKADLRTMMSLCELTAGDMRSAIHTLQFLHKQQQSSAAPGRPTSCTISFEMIQKLDIGSKDMSKSVFSVWEAIFSTPSARQMKKIDFKQAEVVSVQSDESILISEKKHDGQSNGNSAPPYVTRLETLIRSCGDTQLVLKGCFETYLKCRIINKNQGNVSSGATLLEQIGDFLRFFDMATQQIHASQRYQFESYLAFPIIAFHRFFAMPGAANYLTFEYPRQENQVRTVLKERMNILTSFQAGFQKQMRSMWSNRATAVQELVPFLVPLTAPEFKPSNPSLMKENEREILKRLVNVLVSFGMRLVQFVGESGRPSLRLDPPLEKLAYFEGREIFSISRLSYPAKQLIHTEVEKEHIRQVEMSKKNTQSLSTSTRKSTPRYEGTSASTSSRPAGDDASSVTKMATEVTRVPDQNVLETQKPVTLKPVKDFFGRVIHVPLDDDEKENMTTNKNGKVKLSFVYHEGFSNAVRKPVLISDLL